MSNHSTSTSDKQGNSARATCPSDEQTRHVHILSQCDTARTASGDSVGLKIAGGGHGSAVMTHSQVDVTIAAELAATDRESNPMDVYMTLR